MLTNQRLTIVHHTPRTSCQQATQTIQHYGLKDWSSSGGTDGIDIEGDGTYVPKKYDGYKTMRNPDAIAAFSVDDKQVG